MRWDRLDARGATAHGGTELPDLELRRSCSETTVETFVRRGSSRTVYSWTWAVADDDVRQRAAAEVRRLGRGALRAAGHGSRAERYAIVLARLRPLG